MGQDMIAAGWTIDTARKTDEEAVAAFLADLNIQQLLGNLEALDPSGAFEWDDAEQIGDDIIASTENQKMADEVRDTLKVGAEVALDSSARMSAVWDIPETSLGFTVMGGGSWGDDPFEGFSALLMFLAALTLWPELKAHTNIVCEGLPAPSATLVA